MTISPTLALLDLDGTLVNRRAAFLEWSTDWCSAQGLDRSGIEFIVSADREGLEPRASLFGAVVHRFELDVLVEDAIAEYRATFARYFRPDPEINRQLTVLRAVGWRLGVVTNGHATQRAKAESAGLLDLVDSFVISAEVGIRKPDPGIFEAAALRAGAAMEGGWMIGDGAKADILGGQAVGLNTIWISAEREWIHNHYYPDLIVQDITGALSHLQKRQES